MKKFISALLVLAMVFALMPSFALIGSADDTNTGSITLPGDCFHTILNYTDNGDGTHTATCPDCGYTATAPHTIENGACTLCSYVETAEDYTDPDLAITAVNLSLQAYIGAQFRIDATAAAEYDSVYVVVTQGAPTGDTEYTLTENIDAANGGYVYEHKLAAAMMTDNISATVYGVKNETVYTGGSVENWTVKQAAVGRISQYYRYIDRYPQYRAYCVMFADMLTYGAEAQTTFTYATSRLATADVDSKYLALATTDIPTIADTSYSTSTGATTVTKYSVALGIEASVQLQVRFKLPNKADYTKYEVHYTIEGNEYVVDGADLTYAGTSAYVALVVNEVASAWMRSPINITVYDKSTNQPASATFIESVESAANARLGTAIDSLVKAMMKFGDAADGYFNYGT